MSKCELNLFHCRYLCKNGEKFIERQERILRDSVFFLNKRLQTIVDYLYHDQQIQSFHELHDQ